MKDSDRPGHSPDAVTGHGTRTESTSRSAQSIARPAPWSGRSILVVLLAAVAALVWWRLGQPHLVYALHHVSTDDATVNSHVTYVGSRVTGVAQEVTVDDNQRVQPGMPLVRLDSKPFELLVEARRAALDRARISVDQKFGACAVAQAELEQARTQVKSQIAGLRAAWFMIASVQDFVRYGTAALSSAIANLHQQEASRNLAQSELARYSHLVRSGGVSQEVIDERRAQMQVCDQQVAAAQQVVQQNRALLGLPQDLKDPATLPANMVNSFNGMQFAVASSLQALVQIGLNLDFTTPSLTTLRDRLLSLAVDQVVEGSPPVVAARARVAQARAALLAKGIDLEHRESQPAIVQAQKELEEAQLQLSYTVIRAPLAGFVTRRTVNPGTSVMPGEALMAIRPLADVWIDANFKETQLVDLKIGQSVDLYVDAYPDRLFHGRVAGFSPGTGAVSSLLPPENATGNFVKVVQRLPVRIELTEPNPSDTPLFAGLSVEPEVDIESPPRGPGAGRRLLEAAGANQEPPSAKAHNP